MSNATSSKAAYKELAKSVPLNRYDIGWVILCIGMAIGGSMIFMPVQVGLKGLWIFLIGAVIAYPGVYLFQDIFLKSLTETDSAEEYTGVITQYLGKNWGILLTIVYFLLMATGMLSYSTAVVRDSALYLNDAGFTGFLASSGIMSVDAAQLVDDPGLPARLLAQTPWYIFIIMLFLISIAAQGERMLFKVSGPMVIIKVGIIVSLALLMIPSWSVTNIMPLPDNIGVFLRDLILTIPFAVFSIVFMPILSPMYIAYRKVEPDRRIATFRALRTSRIAYFILIVTVLFFAISFTLTMSHADAVRAYDENVSALSIASQVLPGVVTKIMTIVLNLFAVITAFFALYLGFHESIAGMVLNIIYRFVPQERVNRKLVNRLVSAALVIGLTGWVLLNAQILFLIQLSGPLFGIVSCFIPCYLIYKKEELRHLRGWSLGYVLFFGLILFISPLLKFLE